MKTPSESKIPVTLRFALIANGTNLPYKFYLEPDGAILPGGKRVTFHRLQEWAMYNRLGNPRIVNEVR